MMLFYSMVCFMCGIGLGWLFSKFLKLLILLFLLALFVTSGVIGLGVVELNVVQIDNTIQSALDINPWGVLLNVPYIIALLAGVQVWKRHLS